MLTVAGAFAGLRTVGDQLTGVRSVSEGDRSADLNSSFLCGFAPLREECFIHAGTLRRKDKQRENVSAIIRAMKIKVVVHNAEEGGYWAEVPAIPGCATQGETFEELLRNLYEAVEGCLSVDFSHLG